ncbi:phytoene/squalene synthase family protein [Ruania halotolerans]|uniref:phytoene/squalene synthase family protein n=1 Tax=Ruania halotolerans TaxID=2897773 RepID=UPI001E40A2E8|nr:squalene/phytoene synthase family protein [Ruania halotolerans]UFU06872.1 squalene/phytoene synthase family protein [Ruania halotolerans]
MKTSTTSPQYDSVAHASAGAVIRAYSTSFGWATALLGEPDRTHVRTIYALVRIADELVDDPDPGLPVPARSELLDCLERDVHMALRTGRSANLVVHAFAATARRYGIDTSLVQPFFDSMRTDLHTTRHNQDGLDTYVHGSAEVVGLMCLKVFTDCDAGAYQRLAHGAARLGAAFQKVNFLRDLAQDRDTLGRSYFPGVDPGRLTDAQRDALLDDIDADLAAAQLAIAELPTRSRRAVYAAHGFFAELSRRLRRTPGAEIGQVRVRVPDAVKARIVLTAMGRRR